MQLADGMGCKKALTCRYHAWTYGLDGRLRAIPDEHGFPGIDKEAHGLVPVTTVEKHGMVFVTQDEAGGASEPAVDNAALPAELLPAHNWSQLRAVRGKLEDRRGGISGGLSHPLDPPGKASIRCSMTI